MALLLAVPAAAWSQGGGAPASDAGVLDTTPAAPTSKPAKMTLRLRGARKHHVTVGKRVRITGTLTPFATGQKVTVSLLRGGKSVRRKVVDVKQSKDGTTGTFSSRSGRLVHPGNYSATAVHDESPALGKASASSAHKFRIKYPGLHRGSGGPAVSLLNKLLRREGYYAPHGSHFRNATGLAVLAYRKVHGMARTMSAPPTVLKTLADGRGSFKPKYPGQGRHVEVDLSHQVMALVDKGKARYTFHISSGKPSTPTIRGHFHFYRKDPGYNSEGMYYSVYFIRGYATHGYTPVPTFPASHGCVRNPIPFSRFIYNWIHLGESIFVYR
jgi:L,D-transpeptidase catalytic domain